MLERTTRIMIVGQPGSGKSTLARVLGEILGLPVIHIDQIHWKPGWVERPKEEKLPLMIEAHSRDQWVFEGGFSTTWPERASRAGMVIWLDFPLTVRAWRVLRRIVSHYGQTRPDLADDCPEHFSWEFIKWIWDTRTTARKKHLEFYSSLPENKPKYRLRNRHEVAAFTAKLRAPGV